MSTRDLPSSEQTLDLRCLRCGSAHVVVIREIRAGGNGRSVDARCADCREQSILTRE
jgi:transposase-like protein